jgi:hypothetical protein
MDFRLTYTGPLPSDGSIELKQDIRQQLHPQLKQLWKEHFILYPATLPHSADGRTGLGDIGDRFAKHGFRWAPLVQRKKGVACAIDFLILRRHPPQATEGFVDIDNRIKTLVDGLRIPDNGQEVPTGSVPTADQDPFCVLMQDDISLYQFSVAVDRWLNPDAPYGHAMVIMQVTLKGPTGDRASAADLLYR